ncbi:uncharacterized protein LOC126241467 isoform X2 [Schistocerca nitens]|uniref:uncharacterized protein LOC126241467 isoform X2 n=1 Tax=Schistocerca nitens TaxID=7011 RepID=UPI002118EE0E|nr:uncharacterized protein LOC126241467 isoform X2 [Schistocerca nitens]
MMSGTGSGIPDFPIVVLTFFVGLTVFAVVYISKLLKAPAAEDSTKRKETEVTKKEKPAANVTQKPSKKKHQEKWTRDSKQTFSHPWLLTSLKGHSGTVLDMDFSSNGKYLATCAEDSEELDPGGEGSEQGSGNSSGSEANKENSPQGQTDGNQKGALLTRRQKKNRTRRNDGSPLPRNNIAAKKSKAKARRSGGADSSGKRNGAPTLRQHAKLNLSDSDLSVLLRHYLLSPDQLLGLGYPVESALYPGRAIIYKNPPSSSNPNSSNVSSCMQSPDPLRSSSHLFDVNAREFVPMSARLGKEPCCLKEDNVHVKNENLKNTVLITDFVKKDQPGMDYSEIGAEWDASHSTKSEKNSLSTGSDGDSADSGINRSGGEEGSSSASQEASDVDGVIEEDQGIVPEIKQSTVNSSERKHLSKVAKAEKLCVSEEKKCVRCGRGFFVTEDGEYLTQEHCLYHWGKLQRVVSAPSKASSMSLRMEYSCCHGKPSSKGCTTAKLHVWNGVGVGINGPFDSYVRTRPRRTHPLDGNYDRSIFLWSTKDWNQREHKFVRINVEYDHATFIKWSPDSKAFIIQKDMENVIEVYKIAKKADGWISGASKAIEFPKLHEEAVIGLGIACSGKYIMSCSNKTDLLIWDLKGQQLAKVDTYLMNTHCARISPCGRFVVASGFAPDVKVWEVRFTKTGEFSQVSRAFELQGHSSGVYDFGFSADSSRMATVSKDGTWKLYDTNIEYMKGEDPHLLMTGNYKHENVPARLALSPNGDVIAIASNNKLMFYSALSGKCDKIIENIYTGPITAVLFDSLGKYVLTAGERHVRVFHNVTGYRTFIAATKEKFRQSVSSAQKERMTKQIEEAEVFLKSIGEKA